MCRLEENIPGGIFISKRTRRTFSQEFKQQIVNLYLAGKPRVEIIREYEDNLTPEQKELLERRKRNQQLEMENDILKQAALIFGRRDK